MSGADPEAPEKQALREKSQSQETSLCQAFAGSTGSWRLQADTLLQGPHLEGQSSASRVLAAGSLHFHKCTENIGSQLPKCCLGQPALRGVSAMSGEGGSGESRVRQSSHNTTLATHGNSQSSSPSPSCLCSPL